jgi:hypothetical protein
MIFHSGAAVRASCRNVVCLKYIPDSWQYPSEHQYNESAMFTEKSKHCVELTGAIVFLASLDRHGTDLRK